MSLDKFQKESINISYISIGVCNYPLILCIPLHRFIPPLLYILLGLGNDMYAKFNEFIFIRIEKLSPEEVDTQNMCLITEIKLDEALVMQNCTKNEVRNLIQNIIDLYSKLKEKGLSRLEK